MRVGALGSTDGVSVSPLRSPGDARAEAKAVRDRLTFSPRSIRNARRWLLWREGKVPYYTNGTKRSGTLDGPEDVARFATLEDALNVLERDPRYRGIGFALGYDADCDAHWQGIDLDDALDGDRFKHEFHERICNGTEAFIERSPSGRGLHIIGLGPAFRAIKWTKPDEPKVEAYSAGRFFTFTGRMLRDSEPLDLAPLAERIRAELRGQGGAREQRVRKAVGTPSAYLERQSPAFRAWLEEHPIEEALAEYGFQRCEDRWTSPRSTSGVPGVVVLDRLRAVSFHASDEGLGTPAANEQATVFNAFDLAARFRFNDDRRFAMRELLAPNSPENRQSTSAEGVDFGSKIAPSPPRFRLRTADEVACLPSLRWRVRGVLPTAGLAAVYGAPGSGKSFLAVDLLGAIAEGRTWFGHRTDVAPAVYVALEGEHGIAQRVGAYRIRHGRVPASLRFIADPFALLETRDVAALAESIRSAGCADGVVAIDTLNRAAPGADENDSADMGRIIAAAKALQSATGGLVLLVHHTGKDASKGLRGHSSLVAALDAAIEVTRDGDRREWKVSKAKDGRDGETHGFRLEVVQLGEDEDGEAIESCVIGAEDTPAQAVKRARLPQGGNQRIVWDALGELLREARHFGKGEAPPGRPCIGVDDAIERTRGRLTCTSDRHASRAREAITGLVARGCLRLTDGWLWVP